MCALQPFLVDGTAAYLLGFSATFALILVAYLSKRQLRDLWGRAWEIGPTSELESRYSAGFWNTELCRVTIARSELATPDPNCSTDNRSEATWLSLPLGTETFQAIAATTAALPGNDFFSQFARELATLLGVQGAIVTELIGTNTYHTHSPSAKLKILGFWGQGWQPSSLEYPLANTPEAIAVKQGMYYCPDRLWEFFPDTGYLAILGACSFLGVSLTDSSGQLLGMIGIFHDQPLPTPDPALSILRIFGVRASAELERHRTQTALRQSEYRYYTLAKMLPVGIFRTDAIGDCLYVNEQYCELAGMMLTEALGEGWMRNLHPSDRSRVIADWEQAVQEKQPLKLEFRFQHAAGSETWVFCQAVPEIGETGEIVGYVGTLTDISDRKASEIALRQAEEKYRSIFENAIEGIFQITPKGHYLSANPALARIYGYESPEELMTKLHDLDRQLYVDPVRRSEFIRLVEEQGSVFEFESQVYRADGSKIWVSENARAVCDAEGQLLYYEGTVENITNRKVTEEKLVHEALHDTLTNLPNRSFFMERLQQSIDLAKRRQDYFFAVLFIDLDRFKVVNDSLGHLVGDKLLVAIAQRLEICLRSRDAVARLGGDEFAILLDGIKDANDATAVAERIQKKLALPFILDEYEVFTSASIGIVCSGWQPGKGALLGPMAPSQALEIVNKGGSSPCLLKYERPEELLRDADAAMYHAKALGKARHEVFDLSMHTRAVALLQLENDLRRAVERHEFLLFYQPIVSLTNGGISGFEVLLRWQHPQRGLVAPGEFIQVAEETRLIVPIGWWMLRSACQQMREWQQQFPTNPPLTISVNLSNQQFTQPDLIEQIEQILTETGLEARSLKLEITESVIMENAESATALLAQLRALGVQLYIDDFGTGYSSLSRLHSFPTDALKIDRAFVSRMCIDEGNEAIVQTILILASHLGMDVIAEGVETAEQLAQLRALQCEYGQGYFFARPLDEKAASVLVASRPKW